jgi:hypothetical protein
MVFKDICDFGKQKANAIQSPISAKKKKKDFSVMNERLRCILVL